MRNAIRKRSNRLEKDLVNRNLLVLGQVGVGKTFAIQQFVNELVHEGEKVVTMEMISEGYRSLTEELNGVTINLQDVESCAFDKSITNVSVPKHYETEFPLVIRDCIHALNQIIVTKRVDYIVIDEGQFLLQNEYFDQLGEFLALAKLHNTKVIFLVQSVTQVLSPSELKKLTESFPLLLAFQCKDLNRIGYQHQLKRGEAFYFDNDKKSLSYISFVHAKENEINTHAYAS